MIDDPRRRWPKGYASAPAGALLLALLLMCYGPTARAGGKGHAIAINVQGLQTLMQMDPHLCLVDVRRAQELNGPLGHIKRALNVPLKAVEDHPLQFPAGKTVVFISAAGRRSLAAARAVAAHGGVAYWVKGGMQAWQKLSGHKVYRGPVRKRAAPQKSGITKPAGKTVPQKESPDTEEKEEEDMGC